MSNKNYSNKGFLTKKQELKRISVSVVNQCFTFLFLLFDSLIFLVSDSVREGTSTLGTPGCIHIYTRQHHLRICL